MLGLILRFAPLGLPPLLSKYGGSVLWGVMLYWLAAAALPHWRTVHLALVCCLLATLVELSRKYHTPALDIFRLTLAGRLLLGRVFTLWDIAFYWTGILFMSVVDSNAGHDNPG